MKEGTEPSFIVYLLERKQQFLKDGHMSKNKKPFYTFLGDAVTDSVSPVTYQNVDNEKGAIKNSEAYYTADKWLILSRFGLLITLAPLLIFLGVMANKAAGVVTGLACYWLFFLYANYLKAIL